MSKKDKTSKQDKQSTPANDVTALQRHVYGLYGKPLARFIELAGACGCNNKLANVHAMHCIAATSGVTIVAAATVLNSTTGCHGTSRNAEGIQAELFTRTSDGYKFASVRSYCQPAVYGSWYGNKVAHVIQQRTIDKVRAMLNSEYGTEVLAHFGKEFGKLSNFKKATIADCLAMVDKVAK